MGKFFLAPNAPVSHQFSMDYRSGPKEKCVCVCVGGGGGVGGIPCLGSTHLQFLRLWHSIANTSKFTQQCNVVPFFMQFTGWSLAAASSAFPFARKCNRLARIMVIRCVMRRAWRHKRQRFRLKCTYCLFPILCLCLIMLEYSRKGHVLKYFNSNELMNHLYKYSL